MIDLLTEKIQKTLSPICAGLDTRLEYVPDSMRPDRGAESPLSWASRCILAYNRELIDAFRDFIPCVKIQSACYEMYGPDGVRSLYGTVRYAKDAGLLVILDAKRNDIGSTASAYAAATIGRTEIDGELIPVFDADATTVNPYLGTDGVTPFVQACEAYDKGIFVLAKTSNPSSGEFQDLTVPSGKLLFEEVMQKVEKWGSGLIGNCGYSEVGAVVGATYPEQGKKLRAEHPTVFFLVPGAGAQGADVTRLALLFDQKGGGAIINTSRAMLTAWKDGQYADLAAPQAAAESLRALRRQIHAAFEVQGIEIGDGKGIDFHG